MESGLQTHMWSSSYKDNFRVAGEYNFKEYETLRFSQPEAFMEGEGDQGCGGDSCGAEGDVS